MFPLHDSVRRLICLGLFLALAAIPAAASVSWCWWRQRPARVAEAAAELERCLALKVELEGFAHRRPGAVCYEGLTLFDPETGRKLFHCAAVEVQWNSIVDWQRRAARELTLTPQAPELTADGWQESRRIAERLLEARLLADEPHVRLTPTAWKLTSSAGAQPLGDVSAVVHSLAGGVQADLSFRLSELVGPEPLRMTLERNRQTAPPTTAFTLYTGGVAAPCSLLVSLLPEFPALGTRSLFSGKLWSVHTAEGREAGLEGEYNGFDLNELAHDGLPHVLGGAARLALKVRLHHGRVEEAAGALTAVKGLVGRSLITAAAGQLGLTRVAQSAASPELTPYEQLAVAFLINSQGLRLEGRCEGCPPGTILADQNGPLAGEPALQPLPLLSLVQTLCGDRMAPLGGGRVSERLLRSLPLR